MTLGIIDIGDADNDLGGDDFRDGGRKLNLRGSVLDRTLSAPPGSPAVGALYIVGPSPTGDWAGQEDNVAYYNGSAWEFYVPAEGWRCWDNTAQEMVVFTAGAWDNTAIGAGGGGGGGGGTISLEREVIDNITADNTVDEYLILISGHEDIELYFSDDLAWAGGVLELALSADAGVSDQAVEWSVIGFGQEQGTSTVAISASSPLAGKGPVRGEVKNHNLSGVRTTFMVSRRDGGTSGRTYNGGQQSPATTTHLVVRTSGGANITAGSIAVTGVPRTASGGGGNSFYDLEGGFEGTPTSSEIIGTKVIVRDLQFPADFAGSAGTINSGSQPTASFDIDVQDDGISIGTVTIGTDGSFTFVTAGNAVQDVVAGSILTFVAPASVDATAANAIFTLLGTAS